MLTDSVTSLAPQAWAYPKLINPYRRYHGITIHNPRNYPSHCFYFFSCSPHVLRTDLEIPPVLPDMLSILVPTQRLPHVESVRVIVVVPDDSPVD